MTYTITELPATGDILTIAIRVRTISGERQAHLTGHHRYALIDGLLWWALNRKLDALVASAYPLPAGYTEAMAHGLHDGEALVAYIHTAPFHESSEERLQRIMRTIANNLPAIRPLSALSPDHAAEIDAITELAELIAERTKHPTDTWYRLEGAKPVAA